MKALANLSWIFHEFDVDGVVQERRGSEIKNGGGIAGILLALGCEVSFPGGGCLWIRQLRSNKHRVSVM